MHNADSVHPDFVPRHRPPGPVVLTIREIALARHGGAGPLGSPELEAAAERWAEAYRSAAIRLGIAVNEVTVEIGTGGSYRGCERITGTVRLGADHGREDLLRLENEVRRGTPLLDLLAAAGPGPRDTAKKTIDA